MSIKIIQVVQQIKWMANLPPSLSFDLIPLLLIVSYVSFQKKFVHTQVCTNVHE